MSQADLARALGISGAMVSRHKAMGMPVHSVAAAEVWRANNLDPFLLKTIRRPETLPCDRTPQREWAADANRFGALALEALEREAWPEFVHHVETLRAALKLLTESEQERVLLPTQSGTPSAVFLGLGSHTFATSARNDRARAIHRADLRRDRRRSAAR